MKLSRLERVGITGDAMTLRILRGRIERGETTAKKLTAILRDETPPVALPQTRCDDGRPVD